LGEGEEPLTHPLDSFEAGSRLRAGVQDGPTEPARAEAGHLGDEGLPISEMPIERRPPDADRARDLEHRGLRVLRQGRQRLLQQTLPTSLRIPAPSLTCEPSFI